MQAALVAEILEELVSVLVQPAIAACAADQLLKLLVIQLALILTGSKICLNLFGAQLCTKLFSNAKISLNNLFFGFGLFKRSKERLGLLGF